MANILILHSDKEKINNLSRYLEKQGHQLRCAQSSGRFHSLLQKGPPDYIFIDIHQGSPDALREILGTVKRENPSAGIIITNQYPDMQREIIAKEYGVKAFLREPFTPTWIDNALNKSKGIQEHPAEEPGLPRIRISVLLKITLPYALLALIFAIAFAILIGRYVLESIQERYTNQLVDASVLTVDWGVQEERRLLETLRFVANTEGIINAIHSNDADALRKIVLPIVINGQEEAVIILNSKGQAVLSAYHKDKAIVEDYDVTKGDESYATLEFVQKVLTAQLDSQGDKYAGLYTRLDQSYLFVSGPIRDQDGSLVGVCLVGTRVSSLAEAMRENSLGHVTLYSLQGIPLASTLISLSSNTYALENLAQDVIEKQDDQVNIRQIVVNNTNYSELLGPWEARGGDDFGVIGIALAQNFIFRPSSFTRFRSFALVGLTFISIFLVGMILARRITKPLSDVVSASSEVANGNLEVRVPPKGNDEIAVVAHAFNYMVTGLQEGFIYRDLLGRTVSPEVRDELRQSFARGNLRLEGQSAMATVMMSDIRSFTNISEKEEPTTILTWLNEYFGALVPLIAAQSGVVDKFEGDAILAFFGVLPKPV